MARKRATDEDKQEMIRKLFFEEGELVQVVRCMDCMDWGVIHPSNKSKKCNFWSSKEEHLYTASEDFCSYGNRRK